MIRKVTIKDRKKLDEMQFKLQKYFSEIDSTNESLPYTDENGAHKYMQKMIDDAKNMNGKIYIAEEDNQIVGFIQGVIIEHVLPDNSSKEGWVGLLYVEPNYRSKGIGQSLLNIIKDYFKTQNCTSMKLLVLSDNKNAISFYERNEFRPHNLEMSLKLF